MCYQLETVLLMASLTVMSGADWESIAREYVRGKFLGDGSQKQQQQQTQETQ